MTKGYMFFNAETANSEQRICQLAYILTDFDGNPIEEPVVQLIDPECEFNPRNVRVHHITGDDVAGKPNIADFCKENNLIQLLSDYVFVAHNAKQADRHYLYKSLRAYGIEMPAITLIDTMQAAANHLSFGRLADVCAHYGIELGKHHDAFCDASACRDVFYKLAEEGAALDPTEWVPGSKSTRGVTYTSKPTDGLGFTNGTHQPIEEILEEFDSMGLRWGPDDVDSLENLRIVVTGLVPGYPGDAIELELKG